MQFAMIEACKGSLPAVVNTERRLFPVQFTESNLTMKPDTTINGQNLFVSNDILQLSRIDTDNTNAISIYTPSRLISWFLHFVFNLHNHPLN